MIYFRELSSLNPIEAPFSTFANRADPDQGLLCLLLEICLDMILH